MMDATDCEGGWTSDALDREEHSSDGLSDKINNLKQEMRWLRCADVRILRQLVAVHEGIETMRWLIDDRGILTSRCSSLSSSLSSLVTVEEHVPSTSPCREDPSPAFYRDKRLTANAKPADQRPPHAETSEPRAASASKSLKVENYSQVSLTAANSLVSADIPKSQTLGSSSAGLHIRNGAETIRRALLRSSRRRQLKADSGPTAASQNVGEKNSVHLTQKSLTVFKSDEVKKEEISAGDEKGLLGYDAQWSWVGTDTEEIRATDIQRPPRAQEPQENHRRDYCTPPEKGRGESQGNHPAATVQKPQGAAATSPQAPPAAAYARADPAIDPETQDPGTYHSRASLTEPRGPGPGKQPLGVSQHTPKHPALDTEDHKYTGRQRLQPPAGSVVGRKQVPHLMGGPKLIQEREQPKTQPDTKNRHTQSQSHIPPSCCHVSDYGAANYQSWLLSGCVTERGKSIRNADGLVVQVPIPYRDNQLLGPGGGPLPSRGGDRQPPQHLNLVLNDPHPYPESVPCTKEGSTSSKLARHPEPPPNKIVPTLQ
ncbi:hypothetical protein CRENBAI_002110 [Crenichthys baileyi]|uniref:Uncharacterized protein n=1 Tax=Crenichthys baileyi TaxID=28760 RepID=A0AAV9QN55_9TELE